MKKEGLFDPSSSPLRAKIVIFLEYAACGLYFSISCKLSPEQTYALIIFSVFTVFEAVSGTQPRRRLPTRTKNRRFHISETLSGHGELKPFL